ncbi:YcjF family protein [Vibrio lamellibrachiae]|uniref:YcjF family protein n=1 Tax=Vibrio lamellibrachiae TaxID=2910253 RepID=UPI003D0C1FA6
MTDLKTKHIFTQPLDSTSSDGRKNATDANSNVSGESELNAQQILDTQQAEMFVPSVAIEESPEVELDQLIRPKKGSKRLFAALFTVFSGLLSWQAIDSILTAITTADWLSLGWSGLIATISALGVGAIGKELWKLRKLRHHFTAQEQSEALIKQGGVGKARSFCIDIAKQSGLTDENPSFDRWKNSITDSHSDAEVIELYESLVVSQFDEKAAQIVTKHATESAILVAVSPLALADMALVAWRNLKMIDSLATLYGVELGYWSRVSLFKLVLVNMAAAGASELAIDASMDLLSMDVAGKLSARAGQGIGVGILSARIGIKAIALLRPMAWQKENALTLSTIRKQIVSKVAAISIK